MTSPYDIVLESVSSIRSNGGSDAPIAVILGSGLGGFVDALTDCRAIPYEDIDHFPVSTVEGHAGRLVFGRHGDIPVIGMQGRFHCYEGYTPDQVVLPVRVMRQLGVEIMVVTNSSGGIRADFSEGDLMLIEDHLNLMGRNPLTGPNEARFGTRFPDMSDAYDSELRGLAVEAAEELGIDLKRGVYAALLGPSYETPAEIRMLATLGADTVGMSTVPEVIQYYDRRMPTLGWKAVRTPPGQGIDDSILGYSNGNGNLCIIVVSEAEGGSHVTVVRNETK